MSLDRSPHDELHDLLLAMEVGSISAEGIAQVDELVCGDVNLLRLYLERTRMISDLRCGRSAAIVRTVLSQVLRQEGGGQRATGNSASTSEAVGKPFPFPTIDLQNPSGFSPHVLPFGGFLFSYLIAGIVVGIGLLLGWACRVAEYQDLADNRPRGVPTVVQNDKEPAFVGRVTSLIDCQWTDPTAAAVAYANVPLGRKYALASGIMEITYDTGARVILQGPCTYQVESKAGGYLSLGRLTARVESKGEGATRKAEEKEASNPAVAKTRTPAPPSPFPLPPSSLFSVRTPTAVVTDLGTEFGVEVGKQGSTLSLVFRGSVKVQAIGANGPTAQETVLGENESARVEPGGASAVKILKTSSPADATRFVRNVGRRAPNAGHVRLLSEFDFEGDTRNSVRGAPGGTVRGVDGARTSAHYVAGKIGKAAISLDGLRNFVDTTSSGYPNCTAGLQSGSYSFWINSTHTATREMVVHSSGKAAAFSVRLNVDAALKHVPGGVYASVRSEANEELAFALKNPSTNAWADGRWHLIAVTWTATTGASGSGSGAIYIDGVARPVAYGSNAIKGSMPFGWYTYPLVIGANSSVSGTGTGYFLKGALDDVAAWRGQLDATRVKTLYGLACDPVLNYGAKDEQKLANIFAVRGAGATGDGRVWQFATGLVGKPGDVLNHSAVILDAAGNGVRSVPSLSALDPARGKPPRLAPTATAGKGGASPSGS